ncbi:MAG: DoxX family membrane protein [Candidatus Eremiobacteraeota bacterium]|nr:DoxX family membrane protein [Candidatus Eremiobacteraeota bacterium]
MANLAGLLRIAIGLLLLAAGVLKAHDGPAATAATIAGYRILPPMFVAPLGVLLPYVEIGLGVLLVVGRFVRASALFAAVQFAIFALAVASLVVRGIPADCGCFGSGVATPPSWGHVAADVALALVALFVARRAPGAFALDRQRMTA